MGEILGVIRAIPVIVDLFKQVFRWFQLHVGDQDPVKFIADVGKAFQELGDAKTPEEKQKSAKAIQDLIRRG